MTLPNQYLSRFITHIDRNNNMSIVRYILAFGVLISHFNILCGADIQWIVTNYDRVGGFFTLSGFLLIGPILKGISFKEFVWKRIWRICPSYFFVILLTAISLFTLSEYSPLKYFSSKEFWEYICANLTFLNWLHPDLPGVFEDFKINAVNGALWTMKVEWQLTLSLPLLIWLICKYKIKLRQVITIILIVSIIYRIGFHWLYITTEKQIYEILGRQFIGQTLYFYTGIMIYTYYKDFKNNRWPFTIISLILYISFRFFVNFSFYYEILHPFVISFLVLGIAIIPHDIAAYLDRGHNISYEIYLWHFPILQVFAYFGLINIIGTGLTLTLAIFTTILLSIITYLTVGHLYLTRKKSQKIKIIPSKLEFERK